MCDCHKAVNARLAVSNAKIAYGFMYEQADGMKLSPPLIVIEKINKTVRGKLPVLLATCCPFCGARYDLSKNNG